MSTSLKEEQLQPILTVLVESLKSTKKIVIFYCAFLTIISISLINFSNLNYLNNEMIIFAYSLPINFDLFILLLPWTMIISHLCTIEAILSYYKGFYKFSVLKTKLAFDSEKIIYFPSSILNFSKETNLLNKIICIFLMANILLSPIIILSFALGYTNSLVSIVVPQIFIMISNVYFFYKINEIENILKQKKLTIFNLLIIVLSLSLIIGMPLYAQQRILNTEKLISNHLNTEINDLKYLSFLKGYFYENIYPKNTQDGSVHQGIVIESRKLNNLFFYHSDIEKLSVKYSMLNYVSFYELTMKKNIFFNTTLNNVIFYKTQLENQIFKGDIINQNDSVIPFVLVTEFQYKTILQNFTFYSNNIITNSEFRQVSLDNTKLIGINNTFSNIEFENVIFSNFTNEGSNNFISDSNFTLSIFKDSKLSNLIIKNSNFKNTDFNNVTTSSKNFINCEFIYTNNEAYEKNKNFFDEKEKFKNCGLTIDKRREVLN